MIAGINIRKFGKGVTFIGTKTVKGNQHNFFGETSGKAPKKGGKGKGRRPQGPTFIDVETVEGDEFNDFTESPSHQKSSKSPKKGRPAGAANIYGQVIGQQFIKGKKVPPGK